MYTSGKSPSLRVGGFLSLLWWHPDKVVTFMESTDTKGVAYGFPYILLNRGHLPEVHFDIRFVRWTDRQTDRQDIWVADYNPTLSCNLPINFSVLVDFTGPINTEWSKILNISEFRNMTSLYNISFFFKKITLLLVFCRLWSFSQMMGINEITSGRLKSETSGMCMWSPFQSGVASI